MSNPTWLLAKYMPDLARKEPRNVGVILFLGSEKVSRFLPAAEARLRVPENYGHWLEYWAHRMIASETAEAMLDRRRAGDNFYLEFGGKRIGGRPPTIDELYRDLVLP